MFCWFVCDLRVSPDHLCVWLVVGEQCTVFIIVLSQYWDSLELLLLEIALFFLFFYNFFFFRCALSAGGSTSIRLGLGLEPEWRELFY